jgi:hypothetical protein
LVRCGRFECWRFDFGGDNGEDLARARGDGPLLGTAMRMWTPRCRQWRRRCPSCICIQQHRLRDSIVVAELRRLHPRIEAPPTTVHRSSVCPAHQIEHPSNIGVHNEDEGDDERAPQIGGRRHPCSPRGPPCSSVLSSIRVEQASEGCRASPCASLPRPHRTRIRMRLRRRAPRPRASRGAG